MVLLLLAETWSILLINKADASLVMTINRKIKVLVLPFFEMGKRTKKYSQGAAILRALGCLMGISRSPFGQAHRPSVISERDSCCRAARVVLASMR